MIAWLPVGPWPRMGNSVWIADLRYSIEAAATWIVQEYSGVAISG